MRLNNRFIKHAPKRGPDELNIELKKLEARRDDIILELDKLIYKEDGPNVNIKPSDFFNVTLEIAELKLNHEWTLINDMISDETTASDKFLSKKLVGKYLESHEKIIELIKRKSTLWAESTRAGYQLENGVWKFECAPEYELKDVTSWSSDARKLVRVQTNNFPSSFEDPILTVPKPRIKIDSQIMIGDIVNIRFISGDFGKAKVIDIIESKTINSISYPMVVISRNIETGEDYRKYVVDFDYCPEKTEYYEKKWDDKWERQFDDEGDTFEDW